MLRGLRERVSKSSSKLLNNLAYFYTKKKKVEGPGISCINTSNLHVRNIKTTYITLPGWGGGGRIVAGFPK
jgi:hypothetical protein